MCWTRKRYSIYVKRICLFDRLNGILKQFTVNQINDTYLFRQLSLFLFSISVFTLTRARPALVVSPFSLSSPSLALDTLSFHPRHSRPVSVSYTKLIIYTSNYHHQTTLTSPSHSLSGGVSSLSLPSINKTSINISINTINTLVFIGPI